MSYPVTEISCDCGAVRYGLSGRPIMTAVCYCVDCQAAGDQMAEMAGVKPFREPDKGTPYVTVRDRDWQALSGETALLPHKLRAGSPTTRYIAPCCHTPMFVKYAPGFWTSVYRMRFAHPPRIEWRNKVAARRSDLPFADDAPRYNRFPLRLFWRLIKARLRGG